MPEVIASDPQETAGAPQAAEQQQKELGTPYMNSLLQEAESIAIEKMAELSAISTQAKHLGVDVDPMQALKDGITPDALRRQVLEQAAANDTADVLAVTPVNEQPADNRLLSAVKKLHHKEGE